MICLDKMLSDGYFDMSIYIYGRIKKDEMYAKLVAHKSKYAVLYQGSYPNQDNALSEWNSKVQKQESVDNSQKIELTHEEASAIVNWVYRSLRNAQEREDFTQELLREIKDFYSIQNSVRFSNGVAYNAAKVDLHFFSSVSGVSSFISSLKKCNDTLIFLEDMQIPIIFCVHQLCVRMACKKMRVRCITNCSSTALRNLKSVILI